MITAFLTVALASFPPSLIFAAAPDASDTKVSLAVGEEKVLSIPGLTRIAVGDPSIFDVHVQPNGEVLVLGKALGHTTFIAWVGEARSVREVEVTDNSRSDLDRMVHSLPGMEDVTVEKYGANFVLQGKVASDADLDKINKLLEGGPAAVNLVKVERRAEEQVVEKINDAFRKEGLRNAHAIQVGDRIFLEGQVEDASNLHRAELIANTIAGNDLPPAK